MQTHPSAGERIGLGITVLLTEAAIYLVVDDSMPKLGSWTVLGIIYLCSFMAALATLITSVISVSLNSVTAPEGKMSENRLLSVFFESDVDSNGFLDDHELAHALQRLMLEDKVLAKLRELIQGHVDAQDGHKGLSFACWFEIIGKFRQHEGFAAFHNPLIQLMLKIPMRRKHDSRLRHIRKGTNAQKVRRLTQKMTALAAAQRALNDPCDACESHRSTQAESKEPEQEATSQAAVRLHVALKDRAAAAPAVERSAQQQPEAESMQDLDRRLLFCSVDLDAPNDAPAELDAPHEAPADSAVPKVENDTAESAASEKGPDSKEYPGPDKQSSDVLTALGFRDLGDPTEHVAQNTGAMIDLVMSCILPLAYTISIVIEFTVIGADFQNADQGIGLVYHNDSLVLSD